MSSIFKFLFLLGIHFVFFFIFADSNGCRGHNKMAAGSSVFVDNYYVHVDACPVQTERAGTFLRVRLGLDWTLGLHWVFTWRSRGGSVAGRERSAKTERKHLGDKLIYDVANYACKLYNEVASRNRIT